MKTYEGKLTYESGRFALVAGRFNELISRKLVDGALDCLQRHNCPEAEIDLIWTPGSYEIPLICQQLAQTGKYAAVIALGAVIRGGTPHFDYVAAEAAKGVAAASLKTQVPIIFGILTTDTIEQAIERAGTKQGNKGWDAALSALEMANLMKEIR